MVLTIDSFSNSVKVYIGGQNRLYQLTSDLEIIASVQTGPQNGSLDCNINKVLLIDYSSSHLITCGSIHGQCSTRNLRNISHPQQNIVSAIVSSSKRKINSRKKKFRKKSIFFQINFLLKMHR